MHCQRLLQSFICYARAMKNISERLRAARIAAGFESISDAVNAYDWKYSTYAGHENGHRGIKNPDLEKYAEAFGVDQAWLLTGKETVGRNPQSALGPNPPGMGEQTVSAFLGRNDTERQRLMALAKGFAPDARHVSLLQLAADVPGFMLMRDDILMVDLNSAPKEGQMLVVQVWDQESGEAETRVAIWQGGRANSAYGATALPVQQGEVTPRGVIIGSVRIA